MIYFFWEGWDSFVEEIVFELGFEFFVELGQVYICRGQNVFDRGDGISKDQEVGMVYVWRRVGRLFWNVV